METENNDLSLSDVLKAAPAPVRDFLHSGKFADAMARVGKSEDLQEPVLGAVSHETLFVLLGLSEASELPENLATEAKLPTEKVGPVVAAIAREVFGALDTTSDTPAPAPKVAPAPVAPPVQQKPTQAGSAPAPARPVATPAPRPAQVSPPAPKAAPQPKPASYAVDPYREPIE